MSDTTGIDQGVAVITGASAGIGMETALAYAARGYALVLAARREQRLQTIATACQALHDQTRTLVVPTDVACEDQVRHLVDAAVTTFGRIDVMVNNAGYGLWGRVWDLNSDDLHRLFEVNFFGVFYGCKAVAPIMARQGSGHIFNLSSVIGKRGSPFHGGYCASKFAISGLTDSLRVELRPLGVNVTCVCPALTETEFASAVVNSPDRSKSPTLRRIRKTPPAVIARKIVRVTGRDVPELVFTPGGKFLTVLAALWPRAADRIMHLYYKDQARLMDETH